MPNVLDEGTFIVQDENLYTSRWQIRKGIAYFFGGSYVTNMRAYQGGPLVTNGLATVRAGYPKQLNMKDAFAGLPAGRMSGAFMVVDFGDDDEIREANAGPPVANGSGVITAGGIKRVTYQVTLDCYHISQEAYAEDAQEDVDMLIEAIKQQLRYDRTLGGICMDAGETRRGIKTHMGHSGQDKNSRTLTNFSISFEVRIDFIA